MLPFPFFIIGNPRSGTSLLRSLMNAHPMVAVPPECGFLLWLHPQWKDRDWSRPDLAAFAEDVCASRKFETWALSMEDLLVELRRTAPTSFSDAARTVYMSYAHSRGKSVACWGDKNNYYIEKVGELRAIFPDARFVHIVRDVRDIACSYRELGKREIDSDYRPRLTADVREIGLEWVRNNVSASQAMQGSATQVFLRYEDLVKDATSTMKKVFADLGVTGDFEVSSTSHLSQLDEPAEFLQWKAKLSGPVDQGSVGRFRNELTPEEIHEIGSVAGELLASYGYERE